MDKIYETMIFKTLENDHPPGRKKASLSRSPLNLLNPPTAATKDFHQEATFPSSASTLQRQFRAGLAPLF